MYYSLFYKWKEIKTMVNLECLLAAQAVFIYPIYAKSLHGQIWKINKNNKLDSLVILSRRGIAKFPSLAPPLEVEYSTGCYIYRSQWWQPNVKDALERIRAKLFYPKYLSKYCYGRKLFDDIFMNLICSSFIFCISWKINIMFALYCCYSSSPKWNSITCVKGSPFLKSLLWGLLT